MFSQIKSTISTRSVAAFNAINTVALRAINNVKATTTSDLKDLVLATVSQVKLQALITFGFMASFHLVIALAFILGAVAPVSVVIAWFILMTLIKGTIALILSQIFLFLFLLIETLLN